MENPQCGNCQFFKKWKDGTAYGVCVRFPVEVTHLQNHWCGEYQPLTEIRLKEPKKPKS
jgi:hypothetical protein